MVLLIREKSLGEIWSFWENVMALYMDGRQIFKTSKRYIREEDNKSNNQVMDKLLIQMSLLVLY
jgi:hypothetical protein